MRILQLVGIHHKGPEGGKIKNKYGEKETEAAKGKCSFVVLLSFFSFHNNFPFYFVLLKFGEHIQPPRK